MSNHLVNSARMAQETLDGLNEQDLGMAREIAERQDKRRLGAKAHPEVVDQAYEELDGWTKPQKTANRALIKNTKNKKNKPHSR